MPLNWLPIKQVERLIWLRTFAAQLSGFVGMAGITPADVASVQADLAAYDWLVECSEALRTSHKSLNAYKMTLANGPLLAPGQAYPAGPSLPPPPAVQVEPGIFIRISMLAQRIKISPGYNRAMGEGLGIEPPEKSDDLGVPQFKARALADGSVELKYKKGRSSGVAIERKRGDEVDFSPLAWDLSPPFIDRDPPLEIGRPELRQYRMRYLQRDGPVGPRSAVVSVSTTV